VERRVRRRRRKPTQKSTRVAKRYQSKKLSKNTAYKRGRQFEYRVKKHFEKLGYYVIRQYASKGAQDLTAIKQMYIEIGNERLQDVTASEVLLIQCKNLKVEQPLSSIEIANLRTLRKITGGSIIHAFNRNHKIIIEEIDDE
jgi:Holliday junction resolvase